MQTSSGDRLARRIRSECVRRGWDLQALAQRAELSRTALYHLLEGHTTRPRGVTLSRLAAAFDIPVEQLLSERDVPPPPPDPARPLVSERDEPSRTFDRQTNPEVEAIAAERPNLFHLWNESDWDELYSTFGTGGALNRAGVVATAEAINRKRETTRRLHLVLETHLRVVAEELIDTLYRMVRPQSNLAASESLRALIANARQTAATQAAIAQSAEAVSDGTAAATEAPLPVGKPASATGRETQK